VAAHANVAVIDADQLGHTALTCESVKQALGQRFGQAIFDANGMILRSEIARRVFGETEQHKEARRDLERIVHPAIEQQLADLIDRAHRDGRDGILLDAAVLLEAGWQDRCDAIVFVDAPEDVRRNRVAARSGWSADELQRREASQLPLEEKRRRSDIVISNANDDSKACQELSDFLYRIRSNCCKPLPKSSQQS
jgi:dephospho-CoA kinase